MRWRRRWSSSATPSLETLPAGPTLMRWLESGMELGNHTWDHPCLDQCDDASQRRQVAAAHEWLANFTGALVPSCSPIRMATGPLQQRRPSSTSTTSSAFLFDHRIERRDAHPLRRSRLRLDSDADLSRVRAIASGAHSADVPSQSTATTPERRPTPMNREVTIESPNNLAVFDSAERSSGRTTRPPA